MGRMREAPPGCAEIKEVRSYTIPEIAVKQLDAELWLAISARL
jgi:hypothetical protein